MLELYPDRVISHRQAALVYQCFPERCNDAATAIRRALELDGTGAVTLNVAAWTSYTMSERCGIPADLKKLQGWTEAALAHDPDNIDSLDTSGHILLAMGEVDAARERFLKVMVHAGGYDVATLFGLARIEAMAGDMEKAREYYKRGAVNMEKTHPRRPDYLWLQNKAAEVLGLEGS